MVMSEMHEKTELLRDIQTSINQIESGQGIEHDDARAEVLKRVKRIRIVPIKAGTVKRHEP